MQNEQQDADAGREKTNIEKMLSVCGMDSFCLRPPDAGGRSAVGRGRADLAVYRDQRRIHERSVRIRSGLSDHAADLVCRYAAGFAGCVLYGRRAAVLLCTAFVCLVPASQRIWTGTYQIISVCHHFFFFF